MSVWRGRIFCKNIEISGIYSEKTLNCVNSTTVSMRAVFAIYFWLQFVYATHVSLGIVHSYCDQYVPPYLGMIVI